MSESITIQLHECDIDHDHDTAWWCSNGAMGSFRVTNIERDVRRLTRALEALAATHSDTEEGTP